MKRIAGSVGLGLAFLVAGCGSGSKVPSPTAAPVPVVATSFSSLHPTAGAREIVQVQFFQGKHRLSGAHLSLVVTYGKKALRAKGGITDKQGIARASFVVPQLPKGTRLHAATTVLYKGKQYQGSNQVKVAG
jgi:hypothetical protein